MAYLKPQSPIQSREDFIYPLTTADQIILSDGSRLEKDGVLTGGSSEEMQTQINELYASIDALRQEILGGAW